MRASTWAWIAAGLFVGSGGLELVAAEIRVVRGEASAWVMMLAAVGMFVAAGIQARLALEYRRDEVGFSARQVGALLRSVLDGDTEAVLGWIHRRVRTRRDARVLMCAVTETTARWIRRQPAAGVSEGAFVALQVMPGTSVAWTGAARMLAAAMNRDLAAVDAVAGAQLHACVRPRDFGEAIGAVLGMSQAAWREFGPEVVR